MGNELSTDVEACGRYQGQVDFADFRLPWGRRHALIVVLGYSRQMSTEKPGVPALQPPLAFPDPGMPSVPGS